MKSRLKDDSLAHNPQVVTELIELTADGIQATVNRERIDVFPTIQKMIERSFKECRFCNA
jgi:hypothetical protein